jgi:hypothetical protein
MSATPRPIIRLRNVVKKFGDVIVVNDLRCLAGFAVEV